VTAEEWSAEIDIPANASKAEREAPERAAIDAKIDRDIDDMLGGLRGTINFRM